MSVFTVVIRLQKNSKQVDWFTIAADGASSQLQHTTLTEIKLPIEEFQTVVIVPGSQLTLTQIKAPRTSSSKLLQAIPYMVENELAENPERFYFAIGNRNEDDSLNIAYTTHKQMSTWIDTLAENGLKPTFMLPDLLILPYEEHTWQIFIENKNALVRTNKQSGFTSELENLPLILTTALQQNSTKPPNKIHIIGQMINKDLFANINIPLEFSENRLDLMTYSAKELTEPPTLNLLQSKYKTEKGFIKLSSKWHKTAVFAAIFLAVFIIGNLGLFTKLKIEQYYLNHKMIKLLMQAVPNATSNTNAKLQVANELQKYQGNPEGAKFLLLMGKIGNATARITTIKIKQIAFNANRIVIKIDFDSFNALDQFVAHLRKQNITVTQNEATTKDKLITATLTIGLTS